MLRFVGRLFPKATVWNLCISPAYKSTLCFSDLNSLTGTKHTDLTKYSLAVNFFNVLTQYQIEKMKGGSGEESSALENERRLKQYAEEIFTANDLDPKVIMSMVQKLNQEGMLNEQMTRNILLQLSIKSHEALHRFSLDFLVNVLRSIEKFEIKLNETEEKSLQSLILFQLGASKWELIKDFLDLFSGRKIAEQLFNKDIELKLIWSLNYANLQIRDFQFFCSLAFSVYSVISNTGDRFQLITEIEFIVEEKFNAKGAVYDIHDIENLLFFFPQDFIFERQTMDKLASNVLQFKSKITFDSFKKFLQLAAINKHVFSQQKKYQQEKVFEYIEDCNTVDDLRLFAYPLNQINLYADPIEAKENILSVIRSHFDRLFTDNTQKEADFTMTKYLYQNSESETEKEAIVEVLRSEVSQAEVEDSFPYLCSLYSFTSAYLGQTNIDREKLAEVLNKIFKSIASTQDIPRFDEGIKQIMKNPFRIDDVSDAEKDLLADIEVNIRSESFSDFVQFDDLKEFLNFVYIANKSRLIPLKFLGKFCPEHYAKFDDKLILEEILSLLPFIKKMPFIQAELVPHILTQAERLVKEQTLHLELLLEVSVKLNYFESMIKSNNAVRDVTKKLWIACEQHLSQFLVSAEPSTSKNVNFFLDDTTKDNKETKANLNAMLNERELTILHEIFQRLVSWNLGSQKLFDTYQLLFTTYFDKYIESGMPQIAYKLAEINCAQEDFTEKLEAYLIKEQTCGDPIDAVQYAWFFALKNNYNQGLWNVISKDLSRLDDIDDIPIQYLLNLYETLFSIKVDKSFVDISSLSRFIDRLDEIWEREHKLPENKFKKAIKTLLDEECYVLEPDVRAGLYKVDYMYRDTNVVLAFGEDSYLANTKRLFGHVEFRKRLLKKLGFKLHVIERPAYLKEGKTGQKVIYVQNILKGIPRDLDRWKAIRNMTVTKKNESRAL